MAVSGVREKQDADSTAGGAERVIEGIQEQLMKSRQACVCVHVCTCVCVFVFVLYVCVFTYIFVCVLVYALTLHIFCHRMLSVWSVFAMKGSRPFSTGVAWQNTTNSRLKHWGRGLSN